MNLCTFEKPSRYINSEINAVYKNAPLKAALAFPDIYDVGMSHLGLKILYGIINSLPYASAERVFSPWLDIEKAMRAEGIPLCSLESKRPLRDFDVVGFSLQYELCYTTVLNMLSLGHIPIRSEERRAKDPLVIAGGPCTVNPLPMSPFIDAFLIGDGEEAIIEITDTLYRWKSEGDGKRRSLLNAISSIDGMYVPLMHGVDSRRVRRRTVSSLDAAPYPLSPVVPFTPLVHDRINIELSRGCSMGCRFCQAGMIYRPLRERSPERVIEIAEAAVRNTGYEEIALTSLSAGDYSYLLYLVRELNKRFSHRKIALSLPSLRVAAVNQDVLKEIKTVRRTGFTIAPEAATARLRAAINKDFGEDDYERALNALFAEGWENLKLYFMVGLPTETDEDIQAIPEMALKALKVAKRYTSRHVNITVSASPFVPKPFTPMQWYGQEEMEKIKARLSYLRRRLSNKRLTFRSHNTDTSLLEAVFSRGDSGLSALIEKAWALGCRLDAWTEAFDFSKWLKAAESCGIDLKTYAMRKFGKESRLPWDNLLDSGIGEDFLIRESRKINSGEITKDCSTQCSACGIDCKSAVSSQPPAVKPLAPCPLPPAPIKSLPIDLRIRLRVRFSKTGVMRYLSHRELMTTIIRVLRRADIPLVYSQGFHPSPKVSFGPPLNVGMSGLREYFDMEVRPDCLKPDLEDTINRYLPEGIKIQGVNPLPEGAASINSFISRYEYEIISANANLMEDFLRMENFVYIREGNSNSLRKGSKAPVRVSVDLREMVEDACLTDNETVRLIAVDRGENKVRINELISAIFRVPPETTGITRLCMSGWMDKWVDPLYRSEFITNHEHEELVHEQSAGDCSAGPLAATYQE